MADAAISTIADLMRAQRPERTLPADFYVRRDVFDIDMAVIFGRHWIHVGVSADVPEEGDVAVVDFGPASIAIVRGDDGEIRAFHNTCRHRGARLLPAGKSTVGKLVCPYHQWTYETSGELIHAPHMGAGFDFGCHGLNPIHLRNIGGLLFACLADEPPADVDDLAAVMGPRLAPYALDETRIAHEEDILEEGNWKLVIENNRECYHCAGTHPELCNSFVDLDFGYDPAELSPEALTEAKAHAARDAAKVAAWEGEGFPSRAVEHLSGHATNFRTQRLVIAGGGEAHTMDGKAASKKLLGAAGRTDLGDLHLWTHNSWHHFMGDHALSFTVIPLGPDRTLVRSRWLVHRDAVEGVDYDLDRLTEVWRATNAQDARLVGLTQAGVSGPGYRPGLYSPHTEGQLVDFNRWYFERLAAHGLGPAPAAAPAAAAAE